MSDDTEETAPHPITYFSNLMRKIPFLIGVVVMLWLVLAKNIPALFAPQMTPPTPALNAPREVAHSVPKAPPIASEAALLPDLDQEHIAHLEEQVANLNNELAALKTQINAKKDDDKLAKNEQLMQAMKAQIDALQENDTQQLAIMTAFSVLKEAALSGEPFANELKQTASLIHNPETKMLLSPLEPVAAHGIGTLAALQSQFDELLPNALSPGHSAGSFTRNIQSLIHIRKEGEQQQGMDDESILARAEAKIHRGEIVGGLKELQALSPPAADTLADWIKNAKDYTDGRKALDTLQVALLKEKPEHPPIAAKVAPAPQLQAKPAAEPAPALVDDGATEPEQVIEEAVPVVKSAPKAKPVVTPHTSPEPETDSE